jgi:hypothetical protein
MVLCLCATCLRGDTALRLIYRQLLSWLLLQHSWLLSLMGHNQRDRVLLNVLHAGWNHTPLTWTQCSSWTGRTIHTKVPQHEENQRQAAVPVCHTLHQDTVFLEETSLVGRPAIAFDDVKQRLFNSLRFMGIKVHLASPLQVSLCPKLQTSLQQVPT